MLRSALELRQRGTYPRNAGAVAAVARATQLMIPGEEGTPLTTRDDVVLRDAERTRLAFLARVLEAFTETLDLDEVLRRVVTLTMEQLDADRAWLLYPIGLDVDYATVSFEATREGYEGAFAGNEAIPLEGSRELIRRAIETPEPLVCDPEDLDPFLREKYSIKSQLAQILSPRNDRLWAFGLHQCRNEREWSREDRNLFAEIGRYATLAISNAKVHRRATAEAAKINAILDQIPEAAAIYDVDGRLERMNAAAQRDAQLFGGGATFEQRATAFSHLDGRPLRVAELPALRALRGEQVRAEYSVADPRRDEERYVMITASPIYDDTGEVIGSVVLARDTTEERLSREREHFRRRRAECLASLNVADMIGREDYDDVSSIIRDSLGCNVTIYFYNGQTDHLELAGAAFAVPAGTPFANYIRENPYRSGEGLPGAVFELGRPLLFSEIRGDDVVEFSRNETEKELKAALGEESLIASPIESYGERVGSLGLSFSQTSRRFTAEDLEFAQAVAERLGAVSRISRLTRISQDGHRAAEELARREVDARARLEAMIESAPIAIAVVSPDELRFEMTNARWAEAAWRFGKAEAATPVVGLRVSEVFPDLERPILEAAERGETTIDPSVPMSVEGQTYYFTRIISPVRGRFSGIIQSVTVLLQDVTEQVRSKREIEGLARMMEERSARLDSIIASMTDALWVYDATGIVVDVNPAALAMFGLASRADAVARGHLREFLLRYPDGRPIPDRDLPMNRSLRGEKVPDYLAVGRHLITAQDIDLSIACAPIESNGIVGAVLVMRDITAIQELDRKKDEFLSVASHELRTPLTTIKGYTQLLEQTVDDLGSEERHSYIASVLSEVERMMGLVSELLDVSRIETNRLQIHPKPVRWISFLERQIAAFRVQNPTRELEFRPQTGDITVIADPDRMRQVIDNLLSNAVKYSPEAMPIELRVNMDDGILETSVVDRGIGIPKDEITQLFERFHRARNVSSRYYGGLGLGLYIAKAIMEAHSGEIRVESVEEQGSKFTITLPVSAIS